MKKCNKCLIEKELSSFHKNNSSKDGRKNICRECFTIQNRKYKKNQNKKYRENNKQKLKEYNKNYELNNKEKRKKWREYNKDKILQNRREYDKKRRVCDPVYRLKRNIRNRVYKSIVWKGFKKYSKTEEILGCSFEEFKIHLESKFEVWMNWENYGLYNGELNYGWDIDHIIPLSSAKIEEDVIKLNHYTNLQPLCSKVNRDIKYRN
jgi:uncharacterized protein with ATP-grasp and redox domains